MNMPKTPFSNMRHLARELLQDGPQSATVAIQQALRAAGLTSAPDMSVGATDADHAKPQGKDEGMIDINPAPAGKARVAPPVQPEAQRASNPLEGIAELVPGLLAKFKLASGGAGLTGIAGMAGMTGKAAKSAPQTIPAGAQFLSGTYSNAAGSRNYKLYVPAAYVGQPLPLVVMLHGCTQDPDDFAAGTQMNSAAEQQPCLVLYPQQSQGANSSRCWNWFNQTDQQRDSGEPSILAGMTREVAARYAVDPRRIYVAGLSAGGAMAAIMGTTYPDLYAGVAVHSGLPYGAATDLPSALAAMQRGVGGNPGAPLQGGGAAQRFKGIPVIVFHGDADHTVNMRNGEQVFAATAPSLEGAGSRTRESSVRDANGGTYTRTVQHDTDGKAVAEHWLIHGLGHAWAGGSADGSYTDARAPDATGAMMRFFDTHPRAA